MRTFWTLTALIICIFCEACRPQRRYYDQETRNRVFQKYLTGTLDEARGSLIQEMQIIEADTVITSEGKAAQMFLTYTRMYLLEMRDGNNKDASSALEKARQWNVARFELAGVSKDEAALRAGSFDPVSLTNKIDQLDRSVNDGKLPRFRELTTPRIP